MIGREGFESTPLFVGIGDTSFKGRKMSGVSGRIIGAISIVFMRITRSSKMVALGFLGFD